MGRLDDAIRSYSEALDLAPDSAHNWSNLGLAQHESGQYSDAEHSLRTALSLDPGLAMAHHNLAWLLQRQHRVDEAIASYRSAARHMPGSAQSHYNLGTLLEQKDNVDEARSHYRAALDASPTFIPAHRALADLALRTVPLWHVPMMNDVARNRAYQNALNRAVRPGSVVFEIGTGSGLLAMMAARYGAETVVTCEADQIVAQAATEVIRSNGYSATVQVVPKHSQEMVVGEHLPRSPDVFVSEIFSSELLGEHVLSSIEDAKRRLLSPQTQVIPQSANIMIALVGGDALCDNLFVADVCEFDLRAFNAIVPKRQPLVREDLPVQLLSDPLAAFSFDFQSQASWPGETKIFDIPVTGDGKCVGILQWIRLQLDDEVAFENAPTSRAGSSSWTRSIYLFPEPTSLYRRDVVRVLAAHNRNCPWFIVEDLTRLSDQ
ncbi:TPR repeat protein [Pigmentiphaga kullae]|uniref:TPR repeat protein n=1 Tax=Pigmentiphaga kullae TaxID=151784 RepID=A0A4Q7NNI6_9BURK|nr:TPR repeat protein [Pigmentiphaga kullae]